MIDDNGIFVQFIYDNQGIASEDLAAHFAVSERTVRTYVKRSNALMNGCATIKKQSRGGYFVEVADQEAFETWLETIRIQFARSNMSPDERVSVLLSDLLSRDEWITVDKICETLCVSRPTVSSDLKQVEKQLTRFDLTLEKKPRYGIRVSGDELSRRLCMANSMVERLVEKEQAATGASDAPERSFVPLDVLAKIVDSSLDACDFSINSLSYQNLLVHISIALMRIQEGNYVPMDDDNLLKLKGTLPYTTAEHIAAGIQQQVGIALPETEVAYIAIHLAGKEYLGESLSGSGNEEGIVISDEIWSVVSQMLEVVWKSFRYDFREDLELRMNLARHIVPLAVRLKYKMHVDNPILTDIRQRYPLAFAMAIDSSAVLGDHYNAVLSENEIGYIAMAFALALERNRTGVQKKNILVVCASGRGSARMLEHRYLEEFGKYVDKVVACDVSHVGRQDFSQIDYVFTTVPIKETLPVPVREVKFFLDDADITQVRGVLKDPAPTASEEVLLDRFPAKLFFSHRAFSTRDDALDFLCARMEETGKVAANFRELVRHREAFAGTTFGNGVAMPHPLEPVCERAFAAVLLLDEPLEWGENDVRAVFMIAISNEDNEQLGGFFRILADLFCNQEDMQALIQSQRRQTLVSLLRKHGISSQ